MSWFSTKFPNFQNPKLKIFHWFDQCSIPLDRSKFISNFKGFWQISFCPISLFLFNSSWSLLELFFFFFVFYRVKALRFSSTSLLRLFYPFFFIKLQHNMHESFKFLKKSWLRKFEVLDVFGCFDLKWSMGFCQCIIYT